MAAPPSRYPRSMAPEVPPGVDDRLEPEVVRAGIVVVLGTIMAILDTTIVAVALDTLAKDFHVSISTISWVTTGYLLALAVVIPVTGWAIHRIGAKPLYIISLLLFIVGSAACGMAWSATSLIAFRVLQGIGVSLEIAVLTTLIAGVVGTVGGVAAGFLGKWTSAVIMRLTDMMFAIPAVLFSLAIVTALGQGIVDTSIAIGVGWIPIYVRVVRTPVLALRESDFVRAGRVLGFSRLRLLSRHILPNIAGVIAVQTSLTLAWAILAEAGLSYLGLGPPPPTLSLGDMVNNASATAGVAWWTLAGPSLAIVVAVIGFNFLGDGLRDAADPRTRTR